MSIVLAVVATAAIFWAVLFIVLWIIGIIRGYYIDAPMISSGVVGSLLLIGLATWGVVAIWQAVLL